MREEIEAHIEMRARHDGIDQAAARRRFGNPLRTQEEMRRVWIAEFRDILVQDTLFTWRSWRRSRGFALGAILVLAFGLGASTALFSALDRILFRSLPYPAADRLVSVGIVMKGPAGTPQPETMIDRGYFTVWQPAPEPLQSVTAVLGQQPCDITEERPERLVCRSVQANFLRVMGLTVSAGRDFVDEDDVHGAPRVALIQHRLWVRRYGGDPNAVGRTLHLDGEPVTIIGILPPDFEFPLGTADLLLPQQLRPLDPKQTFVRFLTTFGRLKDGVTSQQAETALQPTLPALLSSLPRRLSDDSPYIRVRPLRDRQVGDASRTAWILLGASGLLLLIACVNVTNLMLARIAARQQEFAIRSALGAGKGRLACLALTESILLSITSVGFGLLIASALLKLFVGFAPASIPKIEQASLDIRALTVAVALALFSGAAIGVWPAVSVLRSNLLHGSRTTAAAKPHVRFALVTGQIVLTTAMLGGSMLLLRSLWNMLSVPLGVETERVLTLSATLNVARYPTPERQSMFFEELLDRASQTPGILSATLSNASTPLGLMMATSNIAVEGRPWDPQAFGPNVRVRTITPQYFETFRIPILRGRTFVDADRVGARHAAILSASAERVLFMGEDAIGKRIRPQRDGPWSLVVGVVQDVRNKGLEDDPQPELYAVQRRTPPPTMRAGFLSVRTTIDPGIASAFLRKTAADLDSELPVTIETMDEQVAKLTDRPRFVAWLILAFAGLALVLAAAGLYAVASYLVTQRTRDIGVRMALGATPGRVAVQVVKEAVVPIVTGISLGLVLAWISGGVLESQLYGIAASDTVSWIVALLVLIVAMLIAVLRPVLRTARIDPIAALRTE